jgi:hypothetical protein
MPKLRPVSRLISLTVAATGVTVLDAVVPAKIPLVAALPPLWNAWWCGACTALHFVGDGGELRGPCLMCQQVRNPICSHVMIDPDEREELRRTPGLSLSYQSSGVLYSPPSPSRGVKTSGMSSPDDSSQDSSSVVSDGGLRCRNLLPLPVKVTMMILREKRLTRK